jgi:hypothetical protein
MDESAYAFIKVADCGALKVRLPPKGNRIADIAASPSRADS